MIVSLLAASQVSPFYAFEQSDTFGRFVVFLLFCASILAWTIMIDKYLMLKSKREQCSRLLSLFNSSTTADFLAALGSAEGPMSRIGRVTLGGLVECLSLTEEKLGTLLSSGSPPALNPSTVRRIRSIAESQVDEEILEIEQRLGLLSSIVSASPFLGLLGTVWGVMMAFTGMAMEGKADIGAIAPGVSGALLTTVVGLLVAIPAVIGYNILVSQVKEISVDLDNFAENLITRLEVSMPGDINL